MSSLKYRFYRFYLKKLNHKVNKDSFKDIEKHRSRMENFASKIKIPKGVVVTPITPAPVPSEMHFPQNLGSNRVVLYLHGGAYNSGSFVSHRFLAAHIALTTKSKVMVINYRLAPEHPFPSGLLDVISSYNWLLKQGYTPSEITFMGDSAGGGLALASLIYLRDQNMDLPRGAVLISPWLDLTMSMPSIKSNEDKDYLVLKNVERARKMYTGDHNLMNPLISPLFGDTQGLPPLLIQVGSDEMLRDEVIKFAEIAKGEGVDVTLEVWENMVHVWHALVAKSVPESKEALRRIGDYITELYNIELPMKVLL